MYRYGIGSYAAWIWLFLGFVLGFGSLIASIWILFGAYILPGINIIPGLGVFAQNLLIFIGLVSISYIAFFTNSFLYFFCSNQFTYIQIWPKRRFNVNDDDFLNVKIEG